MLSRFVSPRVREPAFEVRSQEPLPPKSPGQLAAHGTLFGLLGLLGGGLLLTGLAALKAMRAETPEPFDFIARFLSMATPTGVDGWIQLGGLLAFGTAIGLFAAAIQAARHGARTTVSP